MATRGTKAAKPTAEAAAASNGAGAGEAVRRLTDAELARGDGARQGRRQRGAQGHGPGRRPPGDDPGPAASTPSRRSPGRSTSSTRPDLTLNQAGLVVRARRIQGGRADTVDQAPAGRPGRAGPGAAQARAVQRRGGHAAGRLRLLGLAQGPLDRAGRSATSCAAGRRSRTCSASRSARSTRSTRRRASSSTDLVAARARRSCLKGSFDAPTRVRSEGAAARIVAELWLYPDGSRILELSTKCLPAADVPGRGRDARLPGRARGRARRGPADQDQDGPRVLRGTAGKAEAADRRVGRPADQRRAGSGAEEAAMRRFVVEAVVDAVSPGRDHRPAEPVPRPPAVPVRRRPGADPRARRRGLVAFLVAGAILVAVRARSSGPVIIAFTGRLLLSTFGLFVVIVNAIVLWVASLHRARTSRKIAQPRVLWSLVFAALYTLLTTVVERGARPEPAADVPGGPTPTRSGELLESLPTPRRNLIIENLRLQQIYDIVYAVGARLGARADAGRAASGAGSPAASCARRTFLDGRHEPGAAPDAPPAARADLREDRPDDREPRRRAAGGHHRGALEAPERRRAVPVAGRTRGR